MTKLTHLLAEKMVIDESLSREYADILDSTWGDKANAYAHHLAGRYMQADRDAWIGELLGRAVEALEDIANHKPGSIDKVNLILQCEGYQKRAQRMLAEIEKELK